MNYRDYEFANIAVRIINPSDFFIEKSKDYETTKDVELVIEISDADLAFEKEWSKEYKYENYGEELYQFSAIYRKLSEYICQKNIMLLHGSAFEYNNQCVIVTAPSGTGKSTHSRLWREAFGDKVTMINDDKPLLQVSGNDVLVWGTPWDGKHNISVNKSVPLKAICILERSAENKVEKVKVGDCLEALLNQVYRPRQVENLVKVMELAKNIFEQVEIYKIYCNMEIDAAKVVKQKIFN